MKRETGLGGRIALVTGAAGGIGAAVVRQLRDEGARVVATDLAAPEGSAGENLWPASLDVTDSAAVDALVAAVEERWGPIDLGANVAGTGRADSRSMTESLLLGAQMAKVKYANHFK